ncbi:MAG: outer membrane beta-barrel domain-containing protein [Myxococcales bacterium]|nr:outer membrane beta-barrel domain-containing protein [Myxococcales bacterium]MCB9645696.1 outer membrane beta-barrel domain-containing protein [Deltaproteobacteria bacterium]
MRRAALPLCLAGVLLASGAARADEDELEAGRVIAVQDRPFRLAHEFTVSAGVLPMDAFYTGLSLGGSYTLHLTDLVSWEAIAFHYSASVDKGLSDQLLERWSVEDTDEPVIQYLVSSHAIFTPFYGKLTLLNNSIVNVSTYLSVGGGAIRYQGEGGFRPHFSIGPGLRFLFGQVVSARLDARNMISPDFLGGADYILHVTASVSFNFGSSRPTDLGDDELEEADLADPFGDLDELYPLSDPERGKKREGEQ